MPLSALRQRPWRSLLLLVAVALLFAQGARVCIHAGGLAALGATGPVVHVETLQNVDAHADDADFHLAQRLALLKLALDIPVVFLAVALLFAGIIGHCVLLRPRPVGAPAARYCWSLRPPLRAPPR